MINGVTMKILADDYILRALQEDVTSEDVTTNAVMPMPKQGKAQLICKETGIVAGLTIFERVFQLLDPGGLFVDAGLGSPYFPCRSAGYRPSPEGGIHRGRQYGSFS